MKTGRYGKPPRSGKFLIIVLVLLCAVLAPANFLSASETASPEVHQSPAPGNGAKEEWKPPSTPEGIAQRIEDIQKEIDLYLKQKEEIRTDDGVESEALRRLTVALGALQNVYSMYNTALENLARAKEEAAEASVSEGTSFIKENPPYNLSFYENVRNQFEGVDQRLKSVLSSICLAEGSLENLGGQVTQLEGRVEELRREAQTPEGKAMTKELQLREAEADLETARVTVFLQKTNLEANNVRQTFLEAQKKILENDLKGVRKNLHFDEADRNGRMEAIAQEITKTREKIAALQAEREKLRSALTRAQGELSSARNDQQRLVARASVAEREAWLKHNQAGLEQAEQELMVLDENRRIWEVRYGLIQGTVKTQEIWDYRSSVKNRIKDLENMFQVQQRKLASMQADILAAQKELEEVKANNAVATRIQKRIEALDKTVQTTNATVAMLLGLFNNYNRFQEELDNQIDAVRIAEQVTRLSKDRFLAFWNISLWSGDGFDVTIAKLVLAIILFIAAFFLSGRLTAFLGRTLLKRFGLDLSARKATQQILFYVFMVSFILSALDLVGIPLTAFAFLGGALAIGIGFGAQNFFNNLISGFILMLSKPIRPDDTIEIDGLFTTVEEIGSRSTRVKTFDNIDVLIPNSYFLNNKIINWTLTDQKIRLRINVGVAYGSDVREVEKLLLKAADDHSRVLGKPEPYVVFREFGPNAMEFSLFFWVDMTNASTVKVASDLRFRLVALFEDKNITVAFPQMDVHLNATEPIEVFMRRPAREALPPQQEEN